MFHIFIESPGLSSKEKKNMGLKGMNLFILDPPILHSTIMSPAALACSLPSSSACYHLSLTNLVKRNCLFLLVKLSALCNQIEIFFIITVKLSHISEGNLMYYHISIIKFHNFVNKSRNISKWKKCSEGV